MRKTVLTLCIISAAVAAAIGFSIQTRGVEAQVTDEASNADERVYMLNVLWFKEDGGAEKYAEYIEATAPFAAKHGGKTTSAYIPEVAIIGEFDADLFFVVEWPNNEAFLGLVQDPDYQKISHLREEAIRDSLLIRCKVAE